ncbi:MAG: DUF481 domain-containing protein [Acidobacteria bacterium]|nr:DUF481 domain-containing protein [Acidobacteriota bacterium]
MALLGALLLLVPSPLLAGEKTDTVVFSNGDHITCEIKILQQGQLTVKTNYSRTMELDWRAVARISSPKYFQILLENGRRVYGTLVDSGENGVVGVKLLDKVDRFAAMEITGLAPIERRFFQRLSGSVNIGATALKSNAERTFNLGSNTSYRSREWYARWNLDWYTSTRESSPRTNKANLGASAYRFLGRRWAIVSTASFAKNDELDLRLRSSLAAGAGYRILETNNKIFIAMAGLNATMEDYGDSSGDSTNLEGDLSLVFNTFTFRKPQVSFNVMLDVYPSFTTSGRYRVALSSNLNYEIISDFFVGFSATYSYDSTPPSILGSQSDWTLTTTLGYTFSP